MLRATLALGEFEDLHHPERLARAGILLDQATTALASDRSTKGRWLSMLGSSQQSYLHALRGEEFQATLSGRRAAGLAQGLVESGAEDPDVWGVLGGYRFWKAQTLGPLRSVLGGDTRTAGLVLTEKAAGARTPLREIWRTSLLWIRFERKEFDLALEVACQGLAEYPGNRLYRQAEGDVLFRLGRLDESLDRYRKSWVEYTGLETLPVNRQSAAGNLARIHFASGRRDSARAWLDTLDAPRYKATRRWLPPSLVRELEPVRSALR